jgi:hypothetical protein
MSDRPDRDLRFAGLEIADDLPEPEPKTEQPAATVISYDLDECDPQPADPQHAPISHVRRRQIYDGQWVEGPRLCTGGEPLLAVNLKHWADPYSSNVFACVRCLRVLLLKDDDLRGPPPGRGVDWGGLFPVGG